jgi:hypothetical protein
MVAEERHFAGGRWIAGLCAYAVILFVFAYAAASTEHGVVCLWSLFFAPLTAASYWITWDGPEVPMIVMFFGVALWWPLMALGLRLSPERSRAKVVRATLSLHYLAGIVLAGSSLDRSQLARLAEPAMAALAGVGLLVYMAGQAAIWRAVTRLSTTRTGRVAGIEAAEHGNESDGVL